MNLLGISLLYIPLSISPQYNIAVDKSNEALYKQIGAEKLVNKLSQYSEDRSKFYLRQLQIEKEAAIIGNMYKIYHDKEINISIGGGRKLALKSSEIKLTIPIK